MNHLQKLFPTHTLIEENPRTYYLEIANSVFDYPFFNEGVQNAIKREHSNTYKTLQNFKKPSAKDLLELKGFIFHTSHCGSTLLVRMLQTAKSIRVISETEAINGLLLAYKLHNLPKKQVQEQLKVIIESYCQALGSEKYVIFKLTSWNVFMINIFKELYPEIASLYIDRNTEEVTNSLLRSDGGFAQWWDHPVDHLRKHFTAENYQYTSKKAYLSHMVEQHRKQALQCTSKNLLKITYPSLIDGFEKILLHLKLKLSSQEIEAAKKATTYYAKSSQKIMYIKKYNNK